MRRAVRNRNLWIALSVWGVYWLFAPFMERHDLFNKLNGVAVAVGIGVLVAYIPGIWRALRLDHREWSAGYYLVSGVVVVCFAVGAMRVHGWLWRWLGRPNDMVDSLLFGFFLWMLISGYLVHLTSVGAIHGKIPSRNWMWAGIAVAAGLGIATLIGLLDPESLSTLADGPYVAVPM